MNNIVNKEEILLKCNAIIANIEGKGLHRYDPADLRDMEFISKEGSFNSLIRKGVLGLELLAPITIRKVFKIPKTLQPTSFYHIGMAYLQAEENDINICANKTSFQICKELIDTYIVEKNADVYWKYPYSNNFFYSQQKDPAIFTMHMHGLARANTLLLLTGRKKNNDYFIDIAVRSILTTLKQHTLVEYPDGSMSISYYCNSDDVTLNVCAEFACWISLVPKSMRSKRMTEIINGIVKLMINEQKIDGAWDYFSVQHHKKWGKPKTIDCHHMATNLTTLLTILENSDVLYPETEKKLIESCDLGMNFFINNFFDQNGRGIELIGRKRLACSVQYAEAVFGLCKYLSSNHCMDMKLKRQISDLLPKIIQQLCSLVKQDGTAPSGIYFGKRYELQSIRWGSAPVLQALITYLAYKKIGTAKDECKYS